MATASSPDALSLAERSIILAALQLYHASVLRAGRAEREPAIAALRSGQAASILLLSARFS